MLTLFEKPAPDKINTTRQVISFKQINSRDQVFNMLSVQCQEDKNQEFSRKVRKPYLIELVKSNISFCGIMLTPNSPNDEQKISGATYRSIYCKVTFMVNIWLSSMWS